MENLGLSASFWVDRPVLVTGHTGFKGTWLCNWLVMLGAKVHGYSLVPPTQPNMFTETDLERRMSSSFIGDICDTAQLSSIMLQVKPDIVFHLAAQPLVRESYADPLGTFGTNVIGTASLLGSVLNAGSVSAVVNVTSDKCYENNEWEWPYRESDKLGGNDPYSASKACSEIVTAAYRESFFRNSGIQLASARAGNVIGGGDWAKDRLIPDFFRAMDSGRPFKVRSPNAIRPWQHVLEPLNGYLLLAERLSYSGDYATAWNFGPDGNGFKSVEWVVTQLCDAEEGQEWIAEAGGGLHEASILKLDSSRAISMLGWKSGWSLQAAIDKTLKWHQAWKAGQDMAVFSQKQIESFMEDARAPQSAEV